MQEKYLAKKFQWPALVVYDERYLGFLKPTHIAQDFGPFLPKPDFGADVAAALSKGQRGRAGAS